MIYVSEPSLIGREREYVNDCLDHNELSGTGRYVQLFETAFAKFCGTDYAVSCCNGTAALHLTLLALGIQPGDDVFIPALTYVATANAVRYCGANPVCVDIDRRTWCMDPEDLRRKASVSQVPACVIPVHLYGVPANMADIESVASDFKMFVVEDAAEAHGAKIGSRRVGSFGTMGTFSFYGNKLMTCGEGGIVTTSVPRFDQWLRLYRGQGVDPYKRFWHTTIGYNYRMTNLQAAIALAQLEQYTEHAARREEVFSFYEGELAPRFICQKRTITSANWMFSLLVPEGVWRDTVIDRMRDAGIETRPVFYPIPALPPYAGPIPPVTESIARRGISLPTHGNLTLKDLRTITDAFFKATKS